MPYEQVPDIAEEKTIKVVDSLQLAGDRRSPKQVVQPFIPSSNFETNWGQMIVEPVDSEHIPEDFLEKSELLVHSAPLTRQTTYCEPNIQKIASYIEDGTIVENNGLRPSRTPHDVNQKQWNNIQYVCETVGEYIPIGGGTSYSFYLYNSSSKGLVMIYVSNLSASQGWYPVSMKEVSQTCCLVHH